MPQPEGSGGRGEPMKERKARARRWFVLGNVLMVAIMVGLLALFTMNIQRKDRQGKIETFVQDTDIIRMKVADHMETSCRYVKNWAKLTRSQNWRLEEIAQELTNINSDEEVMIQVLAANTLEGFTSTAPASDPGNFQVSYKNYYALRQELADFRLSPKEDEVLITSNFTNPINAESSIAFVTRLTVRARTGGRTEAYLMRVEPVDRLKRMWSYFDTDADAQVSMISAQGDYTVRASMLKNENFYEFLRSYNELNYSELQQLQKTINQSTKPGSFIYRNSKKQDTLFAYSSSGSDGWAIIRSIALEDLGKADVQWPLLMVTGLAFLALLVLNVFYFMVLNRTLRESLADLEKASAAKTNFLSTMSHDMRTPMNAILGLTELAERHLDEPERIRDSLKKISMAGSHLLTLVNDVLDVSQIESGHVPMSPSAFSLEDSARELTDILYGQAVGKNLDCEILLRNISCEYLYADRVRLNQIWINILSNAVKYTPSGGRIDIILEQWETEDPGRIGLRFVSRDTGIGMSREFQEHLFEAFSRERDGRIDKIQGTGLGMSIVKQLVDQLGGTITVESTQGEGSCFTVELELDTAASPEPEERFPGIQALVVGDPEITASTAAFLEDLGAGAVCAEENKALERLKEGPEGYQLIILDRRMSDKDCLELAEEMAAVPNCPLIALSAFEYVDIEEQARKAGIGAFAGRPLFHSSLQRLLEDPRLRNREEQDSQKQAEPTPLRGIRLLVAEDNEINWEIVEELLEMEGISADHAENGRRCLELLQRAKPGAYAAILMDIQMPECNGIEATKAIRRMQDPQLANIPILAMTANAFAEDIAICMDAGMNGHIAKPVDPRILRAELEKIVKGKIQK